jgi:hypothetical protein
MTKQRVAVDGGEEAGVTENGEIKITPEMVEVGRRILVNATITFPVSEMSVTEQRELVADIYASMNSK